MEEEEVSFVDKRTKLELSYLSLGKAYGLKGVELRAYVVEKTLEAETEKERRREAARVERAKAREEELEQAKMKAETSSVKQGNSSETSHRRVKALEVPKFNGRLSVEKYLEVFESVAKLNGYAEADWLVVLRSCTLETNIYSTVESSGTYEEIKQELLLQYGVTADRLRKDLVSVHQGDESFRQYSMRVAVLLKHWVKMAMTEDQKAGAGAVLEVLSKQLIVASLGKEMKALILAGKEFPEVSGRLCGRRCIVLRGTRETKQMQGEGCQASNDPCNACVQGSYRRDSGPAPENASGKARVNCDEQ